MLSTQILKPSLFDLWYDLKPNTRIRMAMWLAGGMPNPFPPVDNNISMAESGQRFRTAAFTAAPADREECLELIRAQLDDDGVRRDFRVPQIRDSHWNRKLKGARRIEWIPGAVSKKEDA